MESIASNGLIHSAISNYLMLIPLFFPALTAGCTVVNVSGADPTLTRSYLGVANVQISPIAGQSALVTTEGFGVVAGGRSTGFGWMKEAQIFSNDLSVCRAYILVNNNEDLESLKDNLEKLDNVCVFTKEGESWPKKDQ